MPLNCPADGVITLDRALALYVGESFRNYDDVKSTFITGSGWMDQLRDDITGALRRETKGLEAEESSKAKVAQDEQMDGIPGASGGGDPRESVKARWTMLATWVRLGRPPSPPPGGMFVIDN